MSAPLLPLERVLDLASGGATGEMLAIRGDAEFHVYLQRGRIAWATDSRNRFAFGQFLVDNAALSKAELEETMESCRRDRLSFGATLLDWGMVTLTVLRQALHHQVVSALSALAEPGPCETMFLPREGFGAYDTRLTFAAGDVISRDWSMPTLSSFPPVPDTSGTDRILARDRAAVRGASRMQLLDAQTLIGQDPPRFEPIVHATVLGHTLLDGAQLAVVRGSLPTAIGAALANTRRTLWCQLEEGASLGSSATALTQLASLTGRGPSQPRRAPNPASNTIPPVALHEGAGADGSDTTAPLLELLARTPDILGVIVREDDRIVSCVGRAGGDRAWLPTLVRRRAPALDWLARDAGAKPPSSPSEHAPSPSIVTYEGDRWCFGVPLSAGDRRSIWLVTGRHTQHRAGWDYVRAVTLQITHPHAHRQAAE